MSVRDDERLTFPDPRTQQVKGYYDCIKCGHRCWPKTSCTISHPAMPDFRMHTDCFNDAIAGCDPFEGYRRLKAFAMSAIHDIALGRRLSIPVHGFEHFGAGA